MFPQVVHLLGQVELDVDKGWRWYPGKEDIPNLLPLLLFCLSWVGTGPYSIRLLVCYAREIRGLVDNVV